MSLDVYMQYEKGTRGYLDLADLMIDDQYPLFAEILSPAEAELDRLVFNVLRAGKLATATEIKVRENLRLAEIGRADPDEAFSGTAVWFNDRAISAADGALTIVRDASQQLGDPAAPLAQLVDVHSQPDFGPMLAEAREAFIQGLIKFNLDPEEFGEILDIWDEVDAIASSDGIEGLFNRLEENLERFIELREQDDRGNAPHSPLKWWKYVLIAVVIGVSIFAVIACYVWSDCSWVWKILVKVAPWLPLMIKKGC